MHKLHLNLACQKPWQRIPSGVERFYIIDSKMIRKTDIIIPIFLGEGVLVVMGQSELRLDQSVISSGEIQSDRGHLLGNRSRKHQNRLILALRNTIFRRDPFKDTTIGRTARQSVIAFMRTHIGK